MEKQSSWRSTRAHRRSQRAAPQADVRGRATAWLVACSGGNNANKTTSNSGATAAAASAPRAPAVAQETPRSGGVDARPALPESLEPLRGTEPRSLSFQLCEENPMRRSRRLSSPWKGVVTW